MGSVAHHAATAVAVVRAEDVALRHHYADGSKNHEDD
jgi:hypothetical protein